MVRYGNVAFNINHYVDVILTAEGANIANRIDAALHKCRTRLWREGDIYQDQLWRIMNQFGPAIRMWQCPFKTEIRLIDEERIGHDQCKVHKV